VHVFSISPCNTVHHTANPATPYNTLQPTATHCNPLQPTATHTATHCNPLQHTCRSSAQQFGNSLSLSLSLSPCNTLQNSAPHYNALQTLQLTATHSATHLNTPANHQRRSWGTLFLSLSLSPPMLQNPANLCTTLQRTANPAPPCNTLQLTATHCNTLQHTCESSAPQLGNTLPESMALISSGHVCVCVCVCV